MVVKQNLISIRIKDVTTRDETQVAVGPGPSMQFQFHVLHHQDRPRAKMTQKSTGWFTDLAGSNVFKATCSSCVLHPHLCPRSLSQLSRNA